MAERKRTDLIESVGKWLSIVLALGGFLWGIVTGLQSHAIETRRPFLDRQLELYTDATKQAAILAVSDDAAELRKAENQFWLLYWGELAMVENGRTAALGSADGDLPAEGVEQAMVRFGRKLTEQTARPSAERSELRTLSLHLAHMCRNSLAESWGVSDWRPPQYVPRRD
jgi:hypothetical protein